MSFIVSFSSLAMGIALPRYLGVFRQDGARRASYLLGAMFLVGCGTALAILAGLSSPLSRWVFAGQGYEPVWLGLLFFLFGYTVFSTLYSYYRGVGRMTVANLWDLGLSGFGALAVAVIFSRTGSAAQVLVWSGAIFLLPTPFLAYLCWRAARQLRGRQALFWSSTRELLSYGLPRTPGAVALAGILGIGPLLAPRLGTVSDAGYLVVGQSVFRIVESAVVAFGLVALPRIAQVVSDGKEGSLTGWLQDLLTFLFQVGLFATVHLILWSDLITLAWLGSNYAEAIPLMRATLLSLGPYLAYVMLRSVIDAVEPRAVNTLNLFLALVATVGLSLLLSRIGLGVLGLAVATTLGLVGLGSLTCLYLWRRYRFRWRGVASWRCLVLNIVLLLPALGVRRWMGGENVSAFRLLEAFLLEAGLFLIYVLVLRRWRTGWILEIEERLGILR
jgi:O-antigen/teichoic acid export membrane protein